MEQGRQETGGQVKRDACTPVMSKHLGVQLIASWAAVSLALFLLPLIVGPLEATPSSSEPTLPLPPCPWFSASRFWVHGSIRAQFCPSSPLLSGVNSKHYFPHPVLCSPKVFCWSSSSCFLREKVGWWFWVWEHLYEEGKTGAWRWLSIWASSSAPPHFMSRAGLHAGPHQRADSLLWRWVGR